MVPMFPAIGGIASVLLGESQLSVSLVLGIVLACFGAYLAFKKNMALDSYKCIAYTPKNLEETSSNFSWWLNISLDVSI